MQKKCLVHLLALDAILESLFFGVMYAGWGSYVYILIDIGVYSDLCKAGITTNSSVTDFNSQNSQGPNINLLNTSFPYTVVSDDGQQTELKSCKPQQEQLHLLYTVSIGIIFLFAFFWGPFIYRLGVTWPKALSIFLISFGCLMMGFVHPEIPLLIVPGIVFVGLGGVGLLVINMRVSSLLNVGAGFYVAVLSGACDSSVITLRIVKLFYDEGIPLKYPLIGFALLEVLLSGTSLVLHRKFDNKATTYTTTYYEVKNGDVQIADNNDQVNLQLTSDIVPKEIGTENTEVLHQDHLPLRESLCLTKTLTYYVALSIGVFNFLYYLGSINTRLNEAVPNKVSHFTNILAYIMLCGIVTASLPGIVVEWQKSIYKKSRNVKERQLMPNVFPLMITAVLGLLLNVLTFFTSEVVYLVEFVVVTLFRSFLYTTAVSFSVSAYPLKHQSIAFSLGLTVSGIFSMIQIPVFMWYNKSTVAQQQVRIFMTTLVLVTFIHPLRVFLEAKSLTLNMLRSIRKRQPSLNLDREVTEPL